MKSRIYLDNGATSFPKPKAVVEVMSDFLINNGTSIGRGSYKETLNSQRTVFETRELICKLFNFDKVENVIFTKNITESMNILLKGLLKKGDNVIVSSMEHNAVMRPLKSLEKKGVEITRVKCDKFGKINPKDVENAIKNNTKLIVMIHASNVCGTILDVEAIGKIAKDREIFFIVDAAQTAGIHEIDFKKIKANAIAFTGHKSLLGPQGTGGFIIDDELNEKVSPLIEGGTGSASEDENQPTYMPDKFESGTPNVVGIYGLNASLKFILEKGISNIKDHELELTELFINKVLEIKNPNIKIIGKLDLEERLPVISIDFINYDNSEIAYILESEYGIATRVGMHCAPSAHKALGTFPNGTVRFSFSYFNTKEEILYAVESIEKTLKMMG